MMGNHFQSNVAKKQKMRRDVKLLSVMADTIGYTAISRKVVARNVHATIPKGNMGYDQYTVPHVVAVEPTFVAFL